MKCKVCEQDRNAFCTCGYCILCLKEIGHERCQEIADKKYPRGEQCKVQ